MIAFLENIMRLLKIIMVSLVVMYIGVEMIGNITEDINYHNRYDFRVRMEADAERYDARYGR